MPYPGGPPAGLCVLGKSVATGGIICSDNPDPSAQRRSVLADPLEHVKGVGSFFYMPCLAKFASSDGAAESNPTTSSMPRSSGLAIVNSVAVMPTTESLASMPVF